MKNNELATKLEEIVGGVPAKNAIEAIDHLIQQVAMGSAKRAKAIIEKIQELELALKAEEELYLSSMNRLPGDTVIDRPDTFARAPMIGKIGHIALIDLLRILPPNQRTDVFVDGEIYGRFMCKVEVSRDIHSFSVIEVSGTENITSSNTIVIKLKSHA